VIIAYLYRTAISFFDVADHIVPSSAAHTFTKINKYISATKKTEEVRDWKLLVESIQNSVDKVRAPHVIFYDSDANTSSGVNLSGTPEKRHKLKRFSESFSDVITISALDKIFEKRGCLIWNLPETNNIVSNFHSPPSAAVLNLKQRQSHIFNGFVAIVLRLLQKRLRADLVSGLPLARCGWVELEELNTAGSKGTSHLEHEIEELQRDLGRAGFETSTVESSSRRVRLNPKLAATADS
jgi:hypothetical protein